MTNLVIFWDEPLNINAGGIHRTITCLLNGLPSKGFNVRYLYTLDKYQTFHYQTESEHRIFDFDQLREFLIETGCDIILGQEGVFSPTLTSLVRRLDLPGVKLANQYHNSLLYFDKKLNWDFLRYVWANNNSIKSRAGVLARGLAYPLWRWHAIRAQHAIYKYNYENCDLSILLSEHEMPILSEITGDKELKKAIAISNPLSWNESPTSEILSNKKKEVLIVSRIYNIEKRVDLALKVWKRIEESGKFNDWVLRIVGDGVDKPRLEKLTKKLHLENVVWEGRQAPKSYYENARIFLLTSIVEGWALTLTESMQYGVVPIAFDSYPAIKSIITDGVDGILIPPFDVKAMASQLDRLMSDVSLRERIALNGMENCQRFAIDKIIDQWASTLNNLKLK